MNNKCFWHLTYDPANDKTYNATSEDSDQPAHSRSLIRIFADRSLQTIQRGIKVNLAILGGCTG